MNGERLRASEGACTHGGAFAVDGQRHVDMALLNQHCRKYQKVIHGLGSWFSHEILRSGMD